jgi:hypothetical protein
MPNEKSIKMEKKCWDCIHMREVPGDAHISCAHPKTKNKKKDSLGNVFAIFASVGRCGPSIDLEAAKELGILGNAYGIRSGWFNWPYLFDPTWLDSCNGFEEKKRK